MTAKVWRKNMKSPYSNAAGWPDRCSATAM